MQTTHKNTPKRILSTVMSAAIALTLLPSTVLTTSADNNVCSDPLGYEITGIDPYYFFYQPSDIVLGNLETGLATAAVSFAYKKAQLIESDGEVLTEIAANPEDPQIVNAEITRSMGGKELKFRVYYSDTEFIDTEIFTVITYEVTVSSEVTVLSRDTNTADAVFEANFHPIQVKVYSGTEFSYDAQISGTKFKLHLDMEDAWKTYKVRFYYGINSDEYVEASTFVEMPFIPLFDGYVQNTVIPEGEKETVVCAALNFPCKKFEVYSNGKKIYTSPANYNPDYKATAPISESYTGTDLFIRAYYESSDSAPAESIDSEIFHIVKANPSRRFTKQPNDMDITSDNITELSWATNFVPLETEFIWDNNCYFSTDDPRTNFVSAAEWFGNCSTADYRIRAYYGAGAEDYVDSAVFHSVAPEFTVEPIGGYIPAGETMNLEWDTNFKPAKLELWEDGAYYKTLDSNARSIQLDGTEASDYYIQAYYLDEEDSFIFSQSFNVQPTDKTIYNIYIDENIYLYNMTVNSLSLSAVEGDEIYVCYLGEAYTFDRWDGMLSGVTFGNESDRETSFVMPAGDVTLKYLKKVSEPDGILGDVNGSGSINITDITLTAAHVKGKKLLNSEQFARADINRDGKISVTDITKIAAHVKGKKLIAQ